jgi:hypothetical protein
MPEVFGGAHLQWSEPAAMQTREYHFVTYSKNALFTDDMLANLAYNMQRLIFHERRAAAG